MNGFYFYRIEIELADQFESLHEFRDRKMKN